MVVPQHSSQMGEGTMLAGFMALLALMEEIVDYLKKKNIIITPIDDKNDSSYPSSSSSSFSTRNKNVLDDLPYGMTKCSIGNYNYANLSFMDDNSWFGVINATSCNLKWLSENIHYFSVNEP
mmetsp:Transcript_11514/g.16284  ORF Transcript_11514/g.16284 Transcript_11514/m.16284 type:complete len:122 (+) Transcript_11514:1135-1500(+)|eukprot:CAMPEP_0184857272 /NCGR_PEP_ID=MMETSP0580-20130426/2434_1 /TAXON_ID=1118495 /ORGANISM="Dactyliosolen fragilissimus" /LENGTH=121 /DNA_ID=CAMNT_0027352775 /DNA_START=453 /DNA_END=818 /DNA_ORIENTATION=-